MRFLNSVLI
jgi:primosomal replication protein N